MAEAELGCLCSFQYWGRSDLEVWLEGSWGQTEAMQARGTEGVGVVGHKEGQSWDSLLLYIAGRDGGRARGAWVSLISSCGSNEGAPSDAG